MNQENSRTLVEREHPWHLRRVTQRQLLDRRNLIDVHALTLAWLKVEDPSQDELMKELSGSLEDDTTPEDVLGRLEERVLEAHARGIADATKDAEQLAERSFQAGAAAASERWSKSSIPSAKERAADKRALLLVMHHGFLGGSHANTAFLVRRALPSEVSLELLECPHHAQLPSRPQGHHLDLLCDQHFHWLRGCFSVVCPEAVPTLSRSGAENAKRCLVSW